MLRIFGGINRFAKRDRNAIGGLEITQAAIERTNALKKAAEIAALLGNLDRINTGYYAA